MPPPASREKEAFMVDVWQDADEGAWWWCWVDRDYHAVTDSEGPFSTEALAQAAADRARVPTAGEWRVERTGPFEWHVVAMAMDDPVGLRDRTVARLSDEEDARLLAAAGTAASKARDLGYDPIAAVEVLPELIEAADWALQNISEAHKNVGGDGNPKVAQALRDLLACARGDGGGA